MSTKSRYEELKQQIHFHNYRYHVLGAPVISDLEFDKLLKELRQIEADHPDWVTEDSPTLRAGAKPADRFKKVLHPAPILSLNSLTDRCHEWKWGRGRCSLPHGSTLDPSFGHGACLIRGGALSNSIHSRYSVKVSLTPSG